jgi:hypothetical protein
LEAGISNELNKNLVYGISMTMVWDMRSDYGVSTLSTL